MTTTDYDVIEKSHDNCAICDNAIDTAIAHAIGSTGATVTDNRMAIDGSTHTVIVKRVRCRRAGTDCLCPVCMMAAAK